MKKRTILYAGLSAVAVALSGGLYAYNLPPIRETALETLVAETHLHGIAVDANDRRRLYLATHHGLFVVGLEGKARRISEARDDFMGFTTHPTDPSVLFASGHPSGGGNLGFVVSKDGGRSWNKRSNGIAGPVDFHQMDASKADGGVVYGAYGDLQRSADNGQTWTQIGPAPTGLIALATSSADANTLYAATRTGLKYSTDSGRSWQVAHFTGWPVTMVHVTRAGSIYAFVSGIGLVQTIEKDLVWQVVSRGFSEDYVMHLVADPVDHQRLYAITFNPLTRKQSVVASRDGGTLWVKLGDRAM